MPARGPVSYDEDSPVFVISAAAEMAGLHPQTLRQYDRLGLVVPQRSGGGGRRYSLRDVLALREVQALSQDGVSLAGIRRVLELQRELLAVNAELTHLQAEVESLRIAAGRARRVFAAGPGGEVTAMSAGRRPQKTPSAGHVVVWRPQR